MDISCRRGMNHDAEGMAKIEVASGSQACGRASRTAMHATPDIASMSLNASAVQVDSISRRDARLALSRLAMSQDATLSFGEAS